MLIYVHLGLDGFPGQPGDRGRTGFPGAKGDNGFPGFTGQPGEAGFPGLAGLTGDPGPDGESLFGDQGNETELQLLKQKLDLKCSNS